MVVVFATGLQWQRFKECGDVEKSASVKERKDVYTIKQTDPACRKERTTWPRRGSDELL
jgi:hypothetical protein